MREEYSNLIRSNFKSLVQQCDWELIVEKLVEYGVSEKKLKNNPHYNNQDQRHNNRCLFFTLMQLDDTVFPKLVTAIRDTGLNDLANKLDSLHIQQNKSHGCGPFQRPKSPEFTREELKHELRMENADLQINVKMATEFRDSYKYNTNSFYKTRAKKRGIVLVINNYEFMESKDPREHYTKRQGAKVDTKNLKALFKQLGFQVIVHENLTAAEMGETIENFAKFEKSKISDMCFVIVMSHGNLYNNETVICGTDNIKITTSWIIERFNNVNCDLFSNKPKVFLFQTCRGVLIDDLTRRTQTDSAPIVSIVRRTFSDILVAYPTVPGYKAHRDVIRGSWFIDILCEIFMEYACKMDVESMLKKVDERFSKRMSEEQTMQTLNYENYGFKNCFLNPGIYEGDNGAILKIDVEKGNDL